MSTATETVREITGVDGLPAGFTKPMIEPVQQAFDSGFHVNVAESSGSFERACTVIFVADDLVAMGETGSIPESLNRSLWKLEMRFYLNSQSGKWNYLNAAPYTVGLARTVDDGPLRYVLTQHSHKTIEKLVDVAGWLRNGPRQRAEAEAAQASLEEERAARRAIHDAEMHTPERSQLRGRLQKLIDAPVEMRAAIAGLAAAVVEAPPGQTADSKLSQAMVDLTVADQLAAIATQAIGADLNAPPLPGAADRTTPAHIEHVVISIACKLAEQEMEGLFHDSNSHRNWPGRGEAIIAFIKEFHPTFGSMRYRSRIVEDMDAEVLLACMHIRDGQS